MDSVRFDNWARKFSRRKAVSALGVTGAAAAMSRVLPAGAGDDLVTCQMAVQALTSAGPSTGQAYSGFLEITIGPDGAIDSGSFTPAGGIAAPLVGEVDGRALSMRITFSDGQALVLTGTGENDITACTGALSGVFGGPQLGDTGSWLIDPSQSIRSGTGESITPIATATPGAVPTMNPECAAITCAATYVMDPITCECLCPEHYDACGPVCCPGGSICLDEATGECTCPDGTEICGDWCVEVCPPQTYRDYDTCSCVEGCNLTCPEGETLDPDDCVCVNVCPPNNPYYCLGNCYVQPHYECGGTCYLASNLDSNSQMCGVSCQACPSGMPCIAGSCQCPATYTYCSGVGCVSLSDDDFNCGACGNICSGGKTCQGGMCQL